MPSARPSLEKSEDNLRTTNSVAGAGLPPWFYAVLIVAPAVVAVAFICYTGSIWEDFLITFRHTENLVGGRGLVYQEGERVHGFTSVINTLLPAVPLLVGGGLKSALGFYQGCSILALAAGLAFLLQSMRRRLGSSGWELGTVAALVAASTKIIVFSSNGQEGGFLVGFLALGLSAALTINEPGRWRRLALASAGLLYTRPDSPVYIAIVWGVALAGHPHAKRLLFQNVARSVAVASALYLPWLIGAWIYYGSPIPHTIIAKSNGHFLVDQSLFKTVVATWSQFVVVAANIFGPIYAPSNWPEPILLGCTTLGFVAAFYWAAPVRDAFGRACSAGLLVLLLYLSWTATQRVAFPWYFVPASLLGAVVMARAGSQLWRASARAGKMAALVGLTFALVTSAWTLGLVFRQMRIQQTEIEENTRKHIGVWLKLNAKPGDSVYAECLGYIGYYWGGKMLDFPGLVAPEVVQARRQFGDDYAIVPIHLKPNWIVARTNEAESLLSIPTIKEAYEVVGTVDARERIAAHGRFAGDAWLLYDSLFYILHRKP